MPRSMTGYGTAEGPLRGGRLRFEVRSVNHRHLSPQVKVPPDLAEFEAAIRDRLRSHFARGHVNVTALWAEDLAGTVAVDLPRAKAMTAALRRLQSELDLPGEVDLALLARLPEVLRVQRPDGAVDPEALLAILDAASTGCVTMRRGEGERLAADLRERLEAIAALARRIGERAPERLLAERDRLRAAVKELAEGTEADPARLAQEIALLADRWDVTEELVRIGSHLEATRALLAADGEVGRRLGFLAQELLREANTIASKANDAAIAALVIAMKGELEKLREQAENLE